MRRIIGKRIAELQTSLTLISKHATTETVSEIDEYGRATAVHPALQGLDGLVSPERGMLQSKEKLAQLAAKYGLDTVIRWKPKRVSSGNVLEA